MAILANIGPDTYIFLCKYRCTSVACHIMSLFLRHLNLRRRAVNDRHPIDT